MLTFEIEVQNLTEAHERIAELKREFGEDIDVVISITSGNKDKLLNTLDEGAKKFFEDVKKVIKERLNEKCISAK